MNKVYAILLWFALLFCHNGLLAQNGGVIVTGKVYAEDEPEGFIGATVIEQDKNGRIYSSALTDFNGNFSLKIKNPNNSLNFSFVGYKKLTVPIGNKRKFDVKLESQNVMKEVTVKASKLVGGGGLAIPEREYSGAMQKFNTKAIEGVSVASIDDALQGRIAGLDIVAKILNKYLHVELGRAMSLAGMCVALSAAFVYDKKTVVLSVLGTYFNGIVLDNFIFDHNKKRRVCIITEKEEELRKFIINDLHSGATIYEAIGAYNFEKHNEIITIVDKSEYQKLMTFINREDPKAFITVYNVSNMQYQPKIRSKEK